MRTFIKNLRVWKKVLMIIIGYLIFVTQSVMPQGNGSSIIYSSNEYGLKKMYSVYTTTAGKKEIYLQVGVNYTPYPNLSGKLLRLIKNSDVWYPAANGFLNGAWGTEFPSGYTECIPVSLFVVSKLDTNLLIKYQITPAASCPDANTFYTTNGGLNFSNAPFGSGGSIAYPYGADYNPDIANEILFGFQVYNGNGIHKSTNKGLNWTFIYASDSLLPTEGWFSNLGNGFIKFNPYDGDIVYANGRTRLYMSTNGGYNFMSPNVSNFRSIVFANNDSVIYGFNNKRLYRSFNKGFSWDSIYTGINFSALEVNPDLQNILYGGDSSGIHISTNFGMNWALYNNSFTPSRIITGISKDTGTGDTFYVTTTKNVYKVWASLITDNQLSTGSLPDTYSLSQNYPNPFNPSTVISFSLPVDSRVLIKVYDVQGREVQTLVNERLQAGTYETKFEGAGLNSGVYFYRLKAEGYSETKRMVLIK